MSQTVNLRMERGETIAKEFGNVTRIDEGHYQVRSQSREIQYDVIAGEWGWICSCPDAMFRGSKCKHSWAVEISFELRRQVEEATRTIRYIEPISLQTCVACGSASLMKWGIRHTKAADIQKFKCRECGRFFTINIGFEKMHHNPKAVTVALQLYFSGESLRKTKESLKLMGVEVCHQTVLNWIAKYVGLMERYADKIAPQVSNTWRADELYLKVKGNMKYLYAMMDDETRYWIAQEVADTKYVHDARNLLRMSKEIAGKRPHVLITDGAPNYAEAVTREYWPNLEPRTRHIRDIRFDGTIHNNKMERMNGEIRDREEVMRGIKTMDMPILKGMQIFHNFIKPHEGLQGRTPAEAAGLVVTSSDKWLTLIQNASRPNEFRQTNREESPNTD